MTPFDAPVRPVTRGPRFHWFGYYDKLQFDPSCRHLLGMQVDFEHRSPRPDDTIRLGMVDLAGGDEWIELGETRAWCWQQGCMLQWIPGSADEVIFNDREGDRFVSRVLNVRTGERHTLPAPIYTLSPDGRWAAAPDFRRVNHMRPGYGYGGLADPHADERAPEDSGIRRMDLRTGEQELIVSIAEVAALAAGELDFADHKRYFNHLLWNTDGSRLEFLHRWGPGEGKRFGTRMLTCGADGSDLRVVDPHGHTSHFIWRDPKHILAWSRHPSHDQPAFFLYEDGSDRVEVVGAEAMTSNGHVSYLAPRAGMGQDGHVSYLVDTDWILNDAYPDKQRNQALYLYHVPTRRRIDLGAFYSPPEYTGEWRCDLHPRSSPDGRWVCIDSPHVGNGRQMYVVDIGGVTGK